MKQMLWMLAVCWGFSLWGAPQTNTPPGGSAALQTEVPSAEAVTSETSAHLKKWLARYPQADADKDGVLTATEVWTFQMGAPERTRAAAAERAKARAQDRADGKRVLERPKPTFADVAYGPHERNVYDIWLAKGDKPAPLVIFFHPGGWRIGDKKQISTDLLVKLLDAGISVASVNYRYTTQAQLPAPLLDGARALQTMRAKANEYHIDPARVALYGASAGATTSAWIAFHDDMADPVSDDPVARQSTRVTCIGFINGQSSCDPFVVRAWAGELAFQHSVFLCGYGVKTRDELADPALQKRFDEMSPLHWLTADDPPVFMSYMEPDAPVPVALGQRGLGIHHPVFGAKLRERMDALKIPYVSVHAIDIDGDPQMLMADFFIAQLKGRP